MSDSLNQSLDRFLENRTKPLEGRFGGIFRAVVVETNDPLNTGRIRFRCPDLHDTDLSAEDCPWATVATDAGGKRAGSWSSPCVGDHAWVAFERDHPYGPTIIGFADPTRRKLYPYPSIHQTTPLSLNELGQPADRPNDFNPDYLPKDGRPMSSGRNDRYGNLDITSSVGFFPKEHSDAPAQPGYDALSAAAFAGSASAPQVNNPDTKYMARITKYGMIGIASDQGYWWKIDGEYGEFTGDFAADEQFEIARWKYLQRVLNEDSPTNKDARRKADITRYGHLTEMRDTGWAQPGPRSSKSRDGEYGPPRYLSKENVLDLRWIKSRTKGGMLRQASDMGMDPNDDYVKRLLIDEVTNLPDKEDVYWAGKDGRFIRDVTRGGLKSVLDDRGSHPTSAHTEEYPRANGYLVKGRRTGGSKINKTRTGSPTGFYFEFNENDDSNHLTLGSPLGQAIEINDATEYIAVAAGLGRDYAMPWQGLAENEFLRRPTRSMEPDTKSHHLVLDLQNEFIRLKSRSGNGPGPDDTSINAVENQFATNQGLEIRDGSKGDGVWTELVDADSRGLWFTNKYGYGIWRGKAQSQAFILQDDTNNRTVIYNRGGNDSKVQIHAATIEITADNIILHASANLELKGGRALKLEGGGARLTMANGRLVSSSVLASGQTQEIQDLTPPTPPLRLEPTDRGQVYNEPSVVSDEEIEHPITS
jgi:hypothetical protein